MLTEEEKEDLLNRFNSRLDEAFNDHVIEVLDLDRNNPLEIDDIEAFLDHSTYDSIAELCRSFFNAGKSAGLKLFQKEMKESRL